MNSHHFSVVFNNVYQLINFSHRYICIEVLSNYMLKYVYTILLILYEMLTFLDTAFQTMEVYNGSEHFVVITLLWNTDAGKAAF